MKRSKKTGQNNKETPDKEPKLLKRYLKNENKQHRADELNNRPATKKHQILNIGDGINWQNSTNTQNAPKNNPTA